MNLLAQGVDSLSANSTWANTVIGGLVTAVGGLLTLVGKQLLAEFKSSTEALKEVVKEQRNTNHRFRSLETAWLLDIQTRSTTSDYLKRGIQDKLDRRERGEDTREEDERGSKR